MHAHLPLPSADFTPTCTTELGTVSRLYDEFAARNVKVIALSVDPVDKHNGWINDINSSQNTVVQYPIIADLDKAGEWVLKMVYTSVLS